MLAWMGKLFFFPFKKTIPNQSNMNKYTLIFVCLFFSFNINNSFAQTEEEKAEALKPLEKTLVAQLEISIDLKDANTKKKAAVVFENYKKDQLLDSIDVEIINDHVASLSFYIKDDFEQRNKFLVITNPQTKTTEVDMNATVEVTPLSPPDLRKSKYDKCIDLPKGYRIIFKRIAN